MDAESNRLAHALAGFGVGRGDRVASLLENSPAQVVTFFAALKLGAIAVPINTAYKGDFLRHQLADSGAKAVVVQGDFAGRVAEVAGADLPELAAAVVVGPARRGDRRRARCTTGTSCSPARPTTRCPTRASSRRTSRASSTPPARPGPSKGCMLPHNYIVALADQIIRAWQRRRRRRRDHPAAAVPLQRDLGVRGRHAARRREVEHRPPLLGVALLARGEAHRRHDGVDARVAGDPDRRRRRPSRPVRSPAAAVRGRADAARHRPDLAASGSGARRSAPATGSPRRR